MENTTVWVEKDAENNVWQCMECGCLHQFEADGPEENSFDYCPYISQLAEFLGIARETLRRIFQRRGIRPVSHDEMPPLSEFRREFYALGGEQDG